jgi:5-(carboxyamino)imidazole ribonucleotide synthase
VRTIIAPYTDTAALREFAGLCDVVTLEFENIPSSVCEMFKRLGVPFYPGYKALAVSQNRFKEKAVARKIGIPVPNYWPIKQGFKGNDEIEYPVRLKTAELGYDGKGQKQVEDFDELFAAWESFGFVPCIAEKVVNFDLEFSVILARNASGQTAVYEPFHNTHEGGILRTTQWPYTGRADLRSGRTYAQQLANRIKVIGLLAVEFFHVRGTKQILFNELAPRPHNSGHVTEKCAFTSQFEQHIRAVCGLPFADPQPMRGGKMINVIGDHGPLVEALEHMHASVHDYGKKAREGRKLGHIILPS